MSVPGIVICLRDEQFIKASTPAELSLFESVTSAREVHPLKAYPPIVVIVSGIVTDVADLKTTTSQNTQKITQLQLTTDGITSDVNTLQTTTTTLTINFTFPCFLYSYLVYLTIPPPII